MTAIDPFDACSTAVRTALTQHHILKEILGECLPKAARIEDDSADHWEPTDYASVRSSGLVAHPFRQIADELEWRDISLSKYIQGTKSDARLRDVLKLVRTIHFTRDCTFQPWYNLAIGVYTECNWLEHSCLPTAAFLDSFKQSCPAIQQIYGHDIGGPGIRASWKVDFTSSPPTFNLDADFQPEYGRLPFLSSLTAFERKMKIRIHIDDQRGMFSFVQPWLSSDEALDPSLAQIAVTDPMTEIGQVTQLLERRNEAERPAIESIEIHHYPFISTPILSRLFSAAHGLAYLDLGFSNGFNRDTMLPVSELVPILNLAARHLPNLKKLYLTLVGEAWDGTEFDLGGFTTDQLIKKEWLDEIGLTLIMGTGSLPSDKLSVDLLKVLGASTNYNPDRPLMVDRGYHIGPDMGILVEKFVDEPTPIEQQGLWCERDFEQLIPLSPNKKHNLIAADWSSLGLSPRSHPKVDIEDLEFDDNDQPIRPVLSQIEIDEPVPSMTRSQSLPPDVCCFW